ncbi:MAG: ferritin [Candidatus Gastranaerophilales bacterium]|nr:ferritin [Candidatus Gastranaerophilales bacterium]
MDTKLLQAFNKQINHEFYSAYLYFAMSTYFSEIAMQGFCDFMKHKTSQKLECAQKIYDYLILRDEKLIFSKIEEPSVDWINVSDVFSSALSHEEFMLTQIKELYSIAKEADDIAAMEYVSHLLNEQIKSVGHFRKLIFRIKNANIITANIEHLDEIICSL